MKVSQKEIKQRMVQFRTVCKNANVKQTHQRYEIFRELAHSGDHPDVESIFLRIRKKEPTISLDTVYRTVWLLKKLGLITTLGSHHERTRFDANLDHHHHFVCNECGLTEDFTSEEFDNLKTPDALKSVGKIEALQVEVRGTCNRCLTIKSKQKQTETTKQ